MRVLAILLAIVALALGIIFCPPRDPDRGHVAGPPTSLTLVDREAAQVPVSAASSTDTLPEPGPVAEEVTSPPPIEAPAVQADSTPRTEPAAEDSGVPAALEALRMCSNQSSAVAPDAFSAQERRMMMEILLRDRASLSRCELGFLRDSLDLDTLMQWGDEEFARFLRLTGCDFEAALGVPSTGRGCDLCEVACRLLSARECLPAIASARHAVAIALANAQTEKHLAAIVEFLSMVPPDYQQVGLVAMSVPASIALCEPLRGQLLSLPSDQLLAKQFVSVVLARMVRYESYTPARDALEEFCSSTFDAFQQNAAPSLNELGELNVVFNRVSDTLPTKEWAERTAQFLGHQDEDVRQLAVSALRLLCEGDAEEARTASLQSLRDAIHDPDVCMYAANALVRVDPDATRSLEAAIASHRLDQFQLSVVERALEKCRLRAAAQSAGDQEER